MEFNSESFSNKKQVILLLGLIIFLLFLIKREKIHHKIEKFNKSKPAFVFESAKVIELKSGKSVWKFNVSKALINRIKNNLRLFGLQGYFIENEKNILEVITPKADLDLKYSNLHMYEGKMSTIDNPKKILTANKIIWISQKETLSASGNVKLIQDNMIVKSKLLMADNKFKKIKISGNPEITIEE